MTSRVGDIVVDCADPERLAEFWCGVLGYRIFDRDETGVAIRGAAVSPDILFIRVPRYGNTWVPEGYTFVLVSGHVKACARHRVRGRHRS